MVRISLFSADKALHSLLSSALGKDFQLELLPEDFLSGSQRPRTREVILLDLNSNLPQTLQRMDEIRQLVASEASVVVLADDPLRSTATELVRLGAFGYCRRPPSMRELKAMLNRAHENTSLKRELDAVQGRLQIPESCDQLIGSSPQMQAVYDLVNRVASIGASVLITGESGTGKELIARAIHKLGSRANRPFVAVSCGAIPETLIEAELFGHEKGAFTGTVGHRVGLLEQAGDGTLFLDEIGELSLSTQVKLLRVLQQREFSRLGSNRVIPMHARLIFATHQNLSDMVAQGRFRQDLFYRINVVRIEAPALQEHPEDIPSLARHFLQLYSSLYEKRVVEIEPQAVSILQSYAWPGNVRELENVIQRAIVVAHDDVLRIEDLPCNLRDQNIVSIEDFHPGGSFERQLRSYKVKLAIAAVRDCGGNKTEAARGLQISRAYLHRLIRLAEPEMLAEAGVLFDHDHREVGTA